MNSPEESAKYWKRVSSTVNYDGLTEWSRAQGCWRKLLWTIIMLGTMTALVYYTYTVTTQYLAGPSATQLSEQQESSIGFPNVTICHTARLNKTYIEEHITNLGLVRYHPAFPKGVYATDQELMKDFIQYLIYAAAKPFNISIAQGTALEIAYQGNFNKSASTMAAYNFTSFVMDAGLQCRQIFASCSFGAKLFDCCENARPEWNDYGVCYRLNIVGADSSSAQDIPGSTAGLSVRVNVNRRDVPVGGSDDEIGLSVHFTTGQTTPCDNPVYVPPNKNALIRIDATRSSFDPSIDDCTNSPPVLMDGIDYSQGSCNYECMRNITMDRCRCKTIGYGVLVDESEVCTPRMMAQCVLPLTIGFNQSATDDMKALTDQMNCVYNNCPKLCNQWIYDTFVSYQDIVPATYWPHNYTKERKVSPETDSFVFTAFFGEIKYTQVQSTPLWDFNTFICNVGGNLGLWVGLSVVSMVQIIIYCYYIPCCYEGGKTTTFLAPDMCSHVKRAKMRN